MIYIKTKIENMVNQVKNVFKGNAVIAENKEFEAALNDAIDTLELKAKNEAADDTPSGIDELDAITNDLNLAILNNLNEALEGLNKAVSDLELIADLYKNPHKFEHLPDRLKTKEVCLHMWSVWPWAYRFTPQEVMNLEFYEEFNARNPKRKMTFNQFLKCTNQKHIEDRNLELKKLENQVNLLDEILKKSEIKNETK